MHGYLEVQRRTLFEAYRRFLAADRALQKARAEALRWFPGAVARQTLLIGDRGSRMRRLTERRDRALARLMRVREELEAAQSEARRRSIRVVHLIACSPAC